MRVRRRQTEYVPLMPESGVATVPTAAGMLALWRGSAFADVDGYDTWEMRVNERLAEAIELGELVPVGIQSDGAYGVRVAVAPDGPTEREDAYTVVTSEPYLLVADGSPVLVSGVEAVGDEQSSPISLSLPAGRYTVRASIIAWDDEPGAFGPDGRPRPNALPDFLILVAVSGGGDSFRTAENTFDEPG